MARPLRPNIPGAVYHVMSRGVERRSIFLDDEDRSRFLQILGGVVRRYGWECVAFCLMGNHYHFVVRTPRPNLSRGMGVVNSAYAISYNGRHCPREGHLFQGRFRSVLIRSSAHLRIAVRYVLRNPVAATLCEHPDDWSWSSYRATLANGQPGIIAPTVTLAWFGDDGDARERFVRYVGGDDTDGTDDAFIDEVELPCEPGIPRERPALEEILSRQPGDPGIAHAHAHHGYSLTEIAIALGRSKSTVGRRLVAYEAELMRTASTWPRAR
jgi:putative transposase